MRDGEDTERREIRGRAGSRNASGSSFAFDVSVSGFYRTNSIS
jgi:hypothetical protein